jgi:hypothetical protein
LGRNADLHLVSRAYYDNSPSWKYMTTGPAASVHLLAGDILLRTAVSGTADTTLTWIDKWVFKNAGQVQVTNIAAPATPSAGTVALWPDSTDKVFKGKDDAGNTSVMVRPDAGASNNFLTGITTAGVITKAQPAFSNLSGSATDAQVPDTITINGTNNVSWPSVNKSGSSLGDLAQRTIAQLAASTSANLAGVLSDEVGTDKVVFNTDPNFITKLTINSASGIADVDAGAQQTGNVLKVYDSAAGADNLGWLWARRMELGNMLTGSSTVYSPGSVPFGGGNFYQNLRSVQRVNGDPNTFDKWQNLVAWTNIESLTAPHSASIDIYGLEAGVGVIDTGNTHDLWTIFGTHSAAFVKGAGDIDDGLIGVMGKSQAFGSGVIQKHRAVQGWVSSQTGATGSSVLAQGVYGLVSNVSGYTMTTAVAGDFLIDSNAGTIGNAYVVRVRAETTGAGTVSTNRYGLYIADQNVGTVSGTVYNFFSAGTGRKNTIEGHLDLGQYIEFAGISAPAVSPSGKARMFFNGTKFRCSENAGSYVDCIGAGGGGSPGGSDTQVQFNDGGTFGADAGLTYNKTTDALTVAGALTAASFTTSASSAGVLGLGDTDASHQLNITPGSNLTANRTLTLTTGDADRTITLSGNPTLADWFDQAVKAASSPTFAGMTMNGSVSYADGVKQTFNPDGTNAGVNVGSHAGDPSTPANGDLWYDSSANELTARINGANVALGAGGGGSAQPATQFIRAGGCKTGDIAPEESHFYLHSGLEPTIICTASGSAHGYAQLLLGEQHTFYAHFTVPVNWTSGSNTLIIRGRAGTTVSSVVFDVSTACVAAGQDLNSPSFNTAQTSTFNVTNAQMYAVTRTSLTMTGCAAGEQLIVRVKRTDNQADVQVQSLELQTTIP